MTHAPFVAAAYAVFFVLLAADAIGPWLARRRLVARWRGRAAREARRSGDSA